MMTPTPLDPMAGMTATHHREHPDEPQPITDPTDPRYGRLPGDAGEPQPVTDPTDPRSGHAA